MEDRNAATAVKDPTAAVCSVPTATDRPNRMTQTKGEGSTSISQSRGEDRYFRMAQIPHTVCGSITKPGKLFITRDLSLFLKVIYILIDL